MKTISVNSPELRSYLKYIALLLLLLNGIGAFIGGIPMVLHPDGSANGISLTYLEHSPFTDYLIPGIVLVLVNGVCSILVLIGLLLNVRHHSWWVMGQGIVLTGWIEVQMVMLREVNFLHIAFGSMGIALIFLGRYLGRFEWK
jgi:hypothetical protein